MSTNKKAFIIGLFFLIAALFSVTILPVLIKNFTHLSFSEYIFTNVEFFLLFWCACLYAYSSKYYGYQIYSIIGAIAFYFMFIRTFH